MSVEPISTPVPYVPSCASGYGQHMIGLSEELARFELWLSKNIASRGSRRVHLSRVKQVRDFLHRQLYQPAGSASELGSLANAFLAYAVAELAFKTTTVNNFVTTFRLYETMTGKKSCLIGYQTRVKTTARILTDNEISRYLDCVGCGQSKRNQAMVLLFLKAGISVDQCSRIRMSHFIAGTDHFFLAVPGKTSTWLMKLEGELLDALQHWLFERSQSPIGALSPYLFYGQTGERLSPSSIDAAVRKVGWSARLNICCKVLRDTGRALAARTVQSRQS